MVFCYCAGGRDSDECYEVALYEARKKLSWTPETQLSLVMIRDANQLTWSVYKLVFNYSSYFEELVTFQSTVYLSQVNPVCYDMSQLTNKLLRA